MKNKLFKKTAIVLLVIAILISSVATISICAEEGTPGVEIISKNVFFGETLNLMYAVKAHNLSSGDKVRIKLFDENGTEIDTITNYTEKSVNGTPAYVFISTRGVPMQNIENCIYAKAEVYNGNDIKAETPVTAYSVLEYLFERLTASKDAGKVSEEQRELYVKLLEYATVAEKVLTDKTEDEMILNKSFVYVSNGTLDGTDNCAVYKTGETIYSIAGSINSTASLFWQIDSFDKTGEYIDSYTVTDADLKSNGYTVTSDLVIITQRENLITEEDVLAQIATFGNPANYNSSGSTYTKRGCIRFSFPVKAGTKVTFTGDSTKYKVAINLTDNPEYKDTTRTFYDSGWLSSSTYTVSEAHDGLYLVVLFAHRVDSTFTQDEIAELVSMISVTGEKAVIRADRGTLTDEEYNNQIALYGSVPQPSVKTRQRIAFAIKMQAGTEVKFVGDTSVYRWAVVESTNTGSTSYMYDSKWNTTWSDPNASYITQINGSYLLLTIMKVDSNGNAVNLDNTDLNKMHSFFEVTGYKYTEKGSQAAVKAKDYATNSVNHRGYITAPENTLEAFRLSAENGFKMVECDVNFTSDGHAVLLHDSTIDRTSNGTGSISSMTLETVRSYDFGSWKSWEYKGTKIPTFEEFVALCAELELHPYIELKTEITDAQAKSLVETVEKHGLLDNCTWISYKSTSLKAILNYDATARAGLLAASITSDIISIATELLTGNNSVFIDTNYQNLTSDSIDLAKTAGFDIEVYTVDVKDDIMALDAYVSGVTSNFIVAGTLL